MFERILDRLKNLYSSPDGMSQLAKYRPMLMRIGFVMLVSYLLAGAMNAALVPKMTATITLLKAAKTGETVVASVKTQNLVNYHDVKKDVVERNVFNQSGEVPKEEEAQEGGKGSFDIDGPCEKTALKVKLVGMISLDGEGRSIAMIKEDGFDSSDVYGVGDFVIGADSAQIVRIQRNQVIINNAGRKECLSLNLGNMEEEVASASIGKTKQSMSSLSPTETKSVDLDAKFVQSELGEGFGKIIQAARLVPNAINNQMNGFKMFAIQPGSVLDKAGFKDNDVITKVNDTVMEAERGFALYEALNNEKEIRVQILRNGTEPQMLVIRVK